MAYAVPAVAHASTAPLPHSSQPTRLSGRWVTTTAPTTPNDTTTSPMIRATIRSAGFATWPTAIATMADAATSQTTTARQPVMRICVRAVDASVKA